MKTVYLVVEKSTEYNDETYNISDGVILKSGYATLEEAEKEALSQNMKFIKDFNISDFSDYSEYSCRKIVTLLSEFSEDPFVSDIEEDSYGVKFHEVFSFLENKNRPDIIKEILENFNFVTVQKVEIK